MSLAHLTQYDFDIPTKFKSKRNINTNTSNTPTNKSNKSSPNPKGASISPGGSSASLDSSNEIKKIQSMIKTYVNGFGKEVK
mgnify:CR=1 FL=1